jgi:SNF2 family DNA or RNA helicase
MNTIQPFKRTRSEHMLRPYQCRAASIVCAHEMTALFIDMGLGKTAIVLTAIADLKRRNGPKKWLIIAPIKVCETVWRQEASVWEHTQHLTFSLVRGNEWDRAFALHREADIYLINPELVPWLSKWLRHDWSRFNGGLAVDESSLFKDHRSKRFKGLTNYGSQLTLKGEDGKSVKNVDGSKVLLPPHKFPKTVIMTGTPRPQSMMNLWSQMYILDHGIRLHKRFETFRGRYFHSAGEVAQHVKRFELNVEEDTPREDYQIMDSAPERIHELIADVTVELNADEYGILPSIIPVPHMVDLPFELREQYDRFERDAIAELNENMVMAVNGGVKTQMCWQIANGALYDPHSHPKTYQILHDAKLDALDELIEELDTNVLITYQFRHDLERIRKRHPDAIVLPRKAEKVVDAWNQGTIRKLLIHPKSGSHGLNIQYGGNHIIWFSMLWSREQFDQANRRLARPGQVAGEGVFCHTIMTAGTTDELMEASLHEKGEGQARFRSALRKYQEAKRLGMFMHELPDYTFADKNTDYIDQLGGLELI